MKWSFTITITAPNVPTLSSAEFKLVVQAHLDGLASPEEVAILEANRRSWVAALLFLLDEVDRSLDEVRRTVRGAERKVVLADFESESAKIDKMLTQLVGPPSSTSESNRDVTSNREPQLQLSWKHGSVVAWAAGAHAGVELEEALQLRLEEAGASAVGWEGHSPVKLPDGRKSPSMVAPIGDSLGWLVGLNQLASDDSVGLSTVWVGNVAALAVRLVAQGRVVPQLKKLRRSRRKKSETAQEGTPVSDFQVRWIPALVDHAELAILNQTQPGSVAVLERRADKAAFTLSLLADIVHALCVEAAGRLDVSAGPPDPQTKSDVAELFLANLDGNSFQAPSRHGSELARRLDQWSRTIVGQQRSSLVLQLDPPDEQGAWYLAVLGMSGQKRLQPIEQVIVNSANSRRREVEEELTRLERMFPELLRPGARRRGEVVLSQDEAWNLMTVVGPALVDAGFEVRAPALSVKKPTPSLRLTSEEAQDSVVGAQQLANVSWSVVFDEIELTADDIRRLASEARPLVKSHGRWVELDKADLAEAAAALAERADKTRMSGADMLRTALGLEGTTLAGGVSIAGAGWAADLLRSAETVSDHLVESPEGFKGELRSYQAEAYAWLGFLDDAGLGGCLALDMGLGKTPTMLAHIRTTAKQGASLVIAPPAVVGNWAAEAKKFVPDLSVVVHHGSNRASGADLKAQIRNNDLIITTYGTAVRDIDQFEKFELNKVVLDEAQAIKNAASETAQQLRRLNGRTRVALTGTPIENGLGDLWAITDFTNPGLVGDRASFVSQLSGDSSKPADGEQALRALNGLLVFRRTKAEPAIAAELPDRIDELDHCAMTPEQIGLYQAVLDGLVADPDEQGGAPQRKGAVLAAITALKQICNHPAAYQDDDEPLDGRSGKLERLNEIVERVFAADERILIFTHFATWGEKLATYMTERTGKNIACYHGGLARGARDRLVDEFQNNPGAGAMVLSLKAGGTGLNLTAASHVVLYDRWWNPAVEDQARDRVWRIGQKNTVICHRLVCPGTVDERVEEVVAVKRRIADMVLPKSSSVGDLDAAQLQVALGIDPDLVMTDADTD